MKDDIKISLIFLLRAFQNLIKDLLSMQKRIYLTDLLKLSLGNRRHNVIIIFSLNFKWSTELHTSSFTLCLTTH